MGALALLLTLGWLTWRRWCRAGPARSERVVLDLAYVWAKLLHGLHGDPCPLPRKGAALLVANHTCSADALFLLGAVRRAVGFLTAREYYRGGVIGAILRAMRCVPAARDGRDGTAPRVALRRLREGHLVGVFPEGGLSNYGRDRLRRGRLGAAWLALASEAPVYPVFIARGPQTHRVTRAWLWPSRVCVRFGPPVDLSAYLGRRRTRRLLEEVTELLMARIEALRPGGPCHDPIDRTTAPSSLCAV